MYIECMKISEWITCIGSFQLTSLIYSYPLNKSSTHGLPVCMCQHGWTRTLYLPQLSHSISPQWIAIYIFIQIKNINSLLVLFGGTQGLFLAQCSSQQCWGPKSGLLHVNHAYSSPLSYLPGTCQLPKWHFDSFPVHLQSLINLVFCSVCIWTSFAFFPLSLSTQVWDTPCLGLPVSALSPSLYSQTEARSSNCIPFISQSKMLPRINSERVKAQGLPEFNSLPSRPSGLQ